MPTPTWDLLTGDANSQNALKLSPYSDKAETSYLLQFLESTRPATKRKNAVNHSLAMADYYIKKEDVSLSCDWIVAASEHAEHEHGFLSAFLDYCCSFSTNGSASWAELSSAPLMRLDKFSLAVLILRVLTSVHFQIERSTESHLLTYVHGNLPHIYKAMRISEKATYPEQIALLKNIGPKIEEVLQDIIAVNEAEHKEILSNRSARILRSLNQDVVKTVLTPYLPDGFVKSLLPTVVKSLENLLASELPEFLATAQVAKTEVLRALGKLEDRRTAFSIRYFIPFCRKMLEFVERECELSNATKPARLSIVSYPRKYPFHQVGGRIRLRFLLNNYGPGLAEDIELKIYLFADFPQHEFSFFWTELESGSQYVEFDVTPSKPHETVDYQAELRWKNYDGEELHAESTGSLLCQNKSVNWEQLRSEQPYSTEAIDLETERPFVGRAADIQKLMVAVVSSTMGSAYIYGQKRVGKTSLGYELASRAKENDPENFFPIYLEGGEFTEGTAAATEARLGNLIARRIAKVATDVKRPEFATSISPLVDYLDDVLEAYPSARFLIILDEFDQLPIDLYKSGDVGDGFFLKLRAISGKKRIGLLLIGGEKMPRIVGAQGDQLNRFEALAVDYFDKDRQWSDFQDLVRMPVLDSIEYSDDAVNEIYNWSAGNPYFTNMLCRTIFNDCHDRRDSYVTTFEVQESARRAYTQAEENSFSHFWKDAIFDTGLKKEDVYTFRKKVFLAIASVLRLGIPFSHENVIAQKAVEGEQPSQVELELNSFVHRRILTNASDGTLLCRVKLFEHFLTDRSQLLFSTDFTDIGERQEFERRENDAYVKSSEICDLVASWGHYNPRAVGEEGVRRWLTQFGSNQDQRLMFSLLKGVKFYSEQLVREKMNSAMSEIRKKTVERRREGERKRSDVMVTYLGDVGKSGTQYARLFCQANGILRQNVIQMSDLIQKGGDSLHNISAVVAIDDLLGTGQSIETALDKMNSHIGQHLRSAGITMFIVAICGFESAISKVEESIQRNQLPVELIVCDVLDDSDRAFSESANFFANSADRLRAREIAKDLGTRLEKKWPLGFGDCEALIAFFSNCPNNSLPIFYKDTPEWRGILPRQ